MTSATSSLAKLLEVVDLAVHDDGDGSILVEDRLVPAGDVDDRQTLYAESNLAVAPDPAGIGSAVLDRGTHPRDQRRVDVPAELELSDYAAHRRRRSSR